MELLNTFSVDVPVDRAWAVLTDAEQVIPCLPGAALQAVDGDRFEGVIKVKFGPVSLLFTGEGRFLKRDEANRLVVIQASGRDVAGQGNLSVTITMNLDPRGASTEAHVQTDLALSGRAAQFGRGVVADISSRILMQFVRNLEKYLEVDSDADPERIEALDLGAVAGPTLMKFAAAAGISVVAVFSVALAFRRLRRKRLAS
ncbi:SRPBCC family protein [Nocardia sp. alder85J]|uniref:SRPBCC family protein n=1 Tax=Nocardia sp. alder85J TaxID=2862949 RepID=UPI001CD7D607|nr:SRPBCC family protein [Nocardia sp. alder85J]MCX4095669.1 SRPBCC family protein [Nocardia sp. alder85J]